MLKMIEIGLIISLALSYFIYSTLFTINYYFAIGVLFIFILLFFYLHSKKEIDKEKKKMYKIIIIPEMLLIFFSLIILLTKNPSIEEVKKFLARVLLLFATSFGSVAIYDLYGKKTEKILFWSMMLNYMYYIFFALMFEGWNSIVTYLKTCLAGDSTGNSVLEAHEITFSFGLLFIYYFTDVYCKENKRKWICFLFFIIGFKRIGVLALLLACIIYVIISKIESKKILRNLYNMAGIFFLLVTLIWLYMVKNEIFAYLADMYNINFMGRINLYSYVKNQFEISILFFGKALGYVNSINLPIGLHSGVLELYIELGMIPFILYTFNKISLNSKRIFNIKGPYNASRYFVITVYIFILWFTDNVATYLNFIFISNVLFLNIMLNDDKENINDKRQKRIKKDIKVREEYLL